MLYPQRYSELNPTPPAGMPGGLKPSVSVRQSLVGLVGTAAVVLSGGCARSTFVRAADEPASVAASAETNPNLRDFDFVVEKLRLNYAGWETKVTDATRPELDALTARLRAEAATAGPDRFSEILQEWLAFFNDRHIGAAPMSVVQPSQEDAAQAAASTPRLDWTEASVRERLTELGDRRDPLEGVWKINDRYRIGVLRMPGKEGSFSGVVLSTTAEGWSAG